MITKKVALISHTADLHGAERMLLNLALLLQNSESFSPVLLIPGEGELVGLAKKHHIRYVVIPKLPRYIFGKTNSYFLDVIFAAESVRKIFINLMVDVVVINTLTSIAPMLAAIQAGIPALVWVHGIIDSSMVGYRDSQFVYWNEEFLLHSATRLIANSRWTADFHTNMFNISKIDIIPNWTEVDPSLQMDREKYTGRKIVVLGTFEKNKGYSMLLESAKILKQRGVLFEIDLYGGGPDLQHIEGLCKKYEISEQVHLKGITNDIKSVYSNAAVVVSASFVESFGMTLIEAMANKTAVVSTKSGGPQEIVQDGETGYLVERGDSHKLADCLEKIINNPDLARQMGEKGYSVACDNYSPAQATKAFYQILDEYSEPVFYPQSTLNFAALFIWLGENLFELNSPQHQPHLDIAEKMPMVLRGYFDPIKSELIYSVKINQEDLSGIVFNQFPMVLPLNMEGQIEIATLAGQSLRKVKFVANENEIPAQITFTKICNVAQKTLLLKLRLSYDDKNGWANFTEQRIILTIAGLLKRKLGRTTLNIILQ